MPIICRMWTRTDSVSRFSALPDSCSPSDWLLTSRQAASFFLAAPPQPMSTYEEGPLRRIATSHEVTLALLFVLLLAAARVVFLPDATTDGGDSVSRVWGSMRWLEDPHLIIHGVWGPLHTYLLAFVL